MLKYIIITTICWSIFIVTDCILDSIIWHKARKWYNDLILWHRLKYIRIASAVATGYFANELFQVANHDWAYSAFFIFWFSLWRFGLFEYLIDRFAGRI